MLLSKDPLKQALRSKWYWPTMAQLFWRNKGEQVVMLPGSHEWDAEAAEAFLKIPRNDMICVDRSRGVLSSFTQRFKGAISYSGDVFEILEVLGESSPKNAIGLVDLDLCGCANPMVIRGLKQLCCNPAIASGCAIGLTICRRWKPDAEQERMIKVTLAGCIEIDRRYYTNTLKSSHMVTMIYRLS